MCYDETPKRLNKYCSGCFAYLGRESLKEASENLLKGTLGVYFCKRCARRYTGFVNRTVKDEKRSSGQK
jgi:hypothetical protein